jgi:hypothetical protein
VGIAGITFVTALKPVLLAQAIAGEAGEAVRAPSPIQVFVIHRPRALV